MAALAAIAAGTARPAFAAGTSPLEQQFALASGGALKISVNANGWYSVSGKQLAAAGFNLAGGEAKRLQLFADGREIPILLSGVSGGHLKPGGSIQFYGMQRNTRYTDVRTYWLVYGSTPGARIPVARMPAVGRAARSLSFSWSSVHRDRLVYVGWASLDKTHFFGNTFNPSTGPINQTILAQDLDPRATGAVLQVAVHGVTTLAHEVKVSFNGTPLGSFKFTGQVEFKANVKVPGKLLKEGVNNVGLAATGGDLDFQIVDELHLTYARLYRAQNDFLNFVVPPNHAARVTGFTRKNVRLIDITNRLQPKFYVPRVSKAAGAYGLFARSDGKTHRYIALTAANVSKPPAMAVDRPSTWHDDKRGGDLVIISNARYLDALAPFKAFKEQQGLKVSLIDVADLYDEFGYGAHGPDAIKAFTAWTRDHWHPAPHYVLLVGGATYDPRNLLGKAPDADQVPSQLIPTDIAEFPSDEWFGDFNNDGLPELSIGRLPVRTPDQAQLVVGKIIRYEQAASVPNHEALLVADSHVNEDFNTPVAALKPLFPSPFSVDFLRRSDGPNDGAVRKALLAKLNEGPAIVNYFGHGAVNLWSEGGLLQSSDAANLHNTNSLSVYVMMTCINSDFVDPRITSLAQALLVNTDGGAVATIGASSLTSAASQPLHNQAFYRALFGNPGITLGQALDQSRSATNDTDLRKTQMLFGDPTMHVHF